MKKYSVLIAICLSLIVAVSAASAVFCYNRPIEELSFDYFLVSEEEDGGDGWRVYEDRQGKQKTLANDGHGGYMGADPSVKTLYCSTELTQKSDNLMLELVTANRSVSIFLDNRLIYSDFPELDNRIGWLALPMLEYDRDKPFLLTLPADYQGKTLTVAQSYSGMGEKQEADTTFYPCGVRLHYGYGYESKIVAGVSGTMIPAMFFFLLGMLLLAVFIWSAFMGNLSFPMFSLALMSVFLMGRQLAFAPFFHQYFGYPRLDYSLLFYYCSIGGGLLFFAAIFRDFKPLIWTLAVCQWFSIGLFAITQLGILVEYGGLYLFLMELPRVVGVVSLAAALVCVIIQARRKYPFFMRMGKIMFVLAAGSGICLAAGLLIEPEEMSVWGESILLEIQWLSPNITLRYLLFFCMAASIFAFSAELVEQRIRYRAENSILAEKNEMAMDSYENLRIQSEEVMMLRHDTIRHYTLLRTLTEKDPRQAYEYLEELIGQMDKVRPVVRSSNEMLDIIVNGKLALAADKGIAVEVVRCEAPCLLPLTDAELCSLIMNILDNAIAGASRKVVETPYLKLDFHCTGQHFIFSCENAAAPEQEGNRSRQRYGLKIIRRIMKKWGEMVSVEAEERRFKISVAIPLS